MRIGEVKKGACECKITRTWVSGSIQIYTTDGGKDKGVCTTCKKRVYVKELPVDFNVCVLCCLCDKKIPVEATGWAGGNNAQPLADGRCCNVCNALVVEARLALEV